MRHGVNLIVAYLLEVLTAECPRSGDFLLGQGVTLKVPAVGMSLLECQVAELLQDGEIVAHGLVGQSAVIQTVVLKVTDELLVELPEGKVVGLELLSDECLQTAAGVLIVGNRALLVVDAHPAPDVVRDTSAHLHQRHLRVHAALHQFLDALGGEVGVAPDEGVEGSADGQQYLLNFSVGLNRFLALAVQTALARVP